MTEHEPSETEERRGVVRTLANALLLLAGPVYIGTLLPLLRGFWWADLFSHFRVQYAVVLAVALLVARKRKRMRLWIGALLTWNLVAIVGLSFGATRGDPEPNDTVVFAANLLADNSDAALLLYAISDLQPDVVALLEYTPRWQSAVDPIRSDYPHSIEDARSDNFGIALFSRQPLDGAIIDSRTGGFPSILATLPSGLSVLATHPPPPIGSTYAAHRDAQFEEIADLAYGMDRLVIVGDFNATGFSPAFRRLQRDGKLQNAARSWAPTWPTHFIPFSIPLDHALVSEQVVVSEFRVRGWIGSDHYPILVRVR